jgi:hypothetical protein
LQTEKSRQGLAELVEGQSPFLSQHEAGVSLMVQVQFLFTQSAVTQILPAALQSAALLQHPEGSGLFTGFLQLQLLALKQGSPADAEATISAEQQIFCVQFPLSEDS